MSSDLISGDVTVEWNGIPSIIAELETVEDRSAYNVAQFVQARAREFAPVRTGYMKEHIEISKGVLRTWVVQVNAHYAGFVEYGTSRQAPQPFFTPAVEMARAYFVKDMIERLKALSK